MRKRIAISTLAAGLFALGSTAAVAQKGATGDAPFCLKSGAQANCSYQTMAQCEQSKPSSSTNQCIDRSQAMSTTGQGTTSPPPSGSMSPGSSSPSGSMSR